MPVSPRKAIKPYGLRRAMASKVVMTAACLLALALAGCTTGSTLQEARSIPPGGFFEVNLKMDAGDTVEWAWTTDAPVRFDVHTHFDGEVQVHRDATAAQGTGSYTAERTGTHSLLWENREDTPVGLDLTLDGAFRLHSFYPE